MEMTESCPLLEWFANNYKKFGATLEIVTDRSQEGSQFVKGFGGIGGEMGLKHVWFASPQTRPVHLPKHAVRRANLVLFINSTANLWMKQSDCISLCLTILFVSVFYPKPNASSPRATGRFFSVSFWKIGLGGLSYWQWPETLLITQPCNTMSVATASNKRRTSLVWVADFVVLSALGHAVHRVAFDSSRSAFSWLNSTDVSAPAAFCCQRKFAYRWKHLPLLKRSLRQFSDLRGTFRWDSCQL